MKNGAASSTAGASPGESFDVWALISTWRRHLPLFLAIVAVCLVAAFAYWNVKTPEYTSKISLLVEPRQAQVIQQDQQVVADVNIDSMAVDTEVQILNSRDLARRVATKLNLQTIPEFGKGSTIVDVLLSKVQVSRTGLTYVIQLTVTTENADLSQKIAQAYAEQYLQNQVETKLNLTNEADRFLDSRLEEMRQEVEAADIAVQQYKIRHNLMSAEGATMAEQEVSTLNTGLASARAELAEKQARLNAARRQIAAGGGGADTGVALGSDVIKDLRRQQAEVSRRQADLETRYGPLHPEVAKGRRQLADFDTQINAEINRNISNLEAEVHVAQQRYNSLIGSRGAAAGALRADNAAQVGLMELQRKAEASRAVYDAFLNRSKEVAAQSGLRQTDASIFSNASKPAGPSSPNPRLIMSGGLLAGLIFGAIGVIIAELLDKKLRTSTQVEEMLGINAIDSIPMIKGNALIKGRALHSYVADKPFSVFAESMRNLRTNLTVVNKDQKLKTIMFTSSLPGEGKTVTAISFARALALAGHKVLMVDADQRRYSLTKMLDRKTQHGFQDVLQDPTLLSQAIMKDDVTNADLLLVNDKLSTNAEVLSKEHFQTFIDRVSPSYDYIVFDTPPILALSETRLIASMADTVVLLIRWNSTPRNAVRTTLHILDDIGARLAGACLTQVDVNVQTKTGYGDNMHYYNAYRKYYSE